jgi:hypothetical protein
MKKWTIATAAAVVLGGAGLYVVSSPRGVSVLGVDVGGQERGWLSERSVDFIEDLQFKDFKRASTYHLAKTQAARNIPELIQRVFVVKHEVLDITDYKVLEVDLDRAKTRARVRMNVKYRVLGDQSFRDDPNLRRDVELMLYWFRGEDGAWTMELESSLR